MITLYSDIEREYLTVPMDRSKGSILAWAAGIKMWAGEDKEKLEEASRYLSYGIRFIKSAPAKKAAETALEIVRAKLAQEE